MTTTPPNGDGGRTPPTKITLRHVERKLMKLPLTHIFPDPEQPRKEFDLFKLQELARSIASIGLQVPPIVRPDPPRPGFYTIIDGERRWRAAAMVPLHEVECIVVNREISPLERQMVMLAVGSVRENLKPSELIASYARLMEGFGINQAELARRLGVSETKVSNVFAARRLLPELREAADTIEQSIVPIIARRPVAEQKELMGYATTQVDGKYPTREQVQLLIDAKARKGRRQKKPKTLKIELPLESADACIARLQELIEKIRKSGPDGLKAAI